MNNESMNTSSFKSVIPDLIREPVVCSNVGDLRVYSSGSRIKSGMTVCKSLT